MLIQGDAIHIPLENETVGIILTSPPYNVGLGYEGFEDNLTQDEHVEFNRLWLNEAFRVSRDGARIYIIVSDLMLWWMRPLAEEIGWNFAQILTWCKPNFAGKPHRISGDWDYMAERILLFRKGKRTPMLESPRHLGVSTHNWFVETVPQSNFHDGRIHPAQLPISLCLRILSRTPGNLILDPFAGSGSVLIAAKKLGRASIGFDIVYSVCKKAQERFDKSQPPLPLLEVEQLEMLEE